MNRVPTEQRRLEILRELLRRKVFAAIWVDGLRLAVRKHEDTLCSFTRRLSWDAAEKLVSK